MLELTSRERHRLANLRRREVWGVVRSMGAGPPGVGSDADTSDGK
jgi:hypothetical protein